MNTLFNFLHYLKDSKLDINNLHLYGVGEVVRSNNKEVHNMTDTLKKLDENFTCLIIINKSNIHTYCLLIPPKPGKNDRHPFIFHSGFPCFDHIEDGIFKKDNWLISNDLNDEVEIKTHMFGRSYELSKILTPSTIKFCQQVQKRIGQNRDFNFYLEYTLFKGIGN